MRVAIASDSVPLTLESSDVVGSTQAIESGYFGPTRTSGVEVTGTFPSGSHIDVKKNQRIAGGDVQDPCFDWRCGSFGVNITAEVDSAIEDNTLLRGAYAQSGFGAQAVHVHNGAATSIRRNAALVGGNGLGSETLPTAGVDVSGTDTGRATIALEDNTLVAGTPDESGASGSPTGFHGKNVIATIHHNARIVGGYGGVATGLWIERAFGAEPNEATITDNTIDGGTYYGTGLELTGALARVERNVVHACELPDAKGVPAPKCLAATNLDVGKRGLFVDWDSGSVIANNYVFSRETACILGGPSDVTGNPRPTLPVSFVYNTCVAFGPAWRDDYPVVALVLGSSFTDVPLIANNVLDGVDGAFAHDSSYQNAAPTEGYRFLDNDLVPHGQACLANVYLPGQLCYPTVSSLPAKSNATQTLVGNVSLDPKYAHPNDARGAASFHLDSSCALAGLATPIPSVSTDFENGARTSTPAIGPAECH